MTVFRNPMAIQSNSINWSKYTRMCLTYWSDNKISSNLSINWDGDKSSFVPFYLIFFFIVNKRDLNHNLQLNLLFHGKI